MAASFARPLRLAVLASLAVLAPAHGGELRMGGTGSATKLLEQLAGAFTTETDAKIEVIPSLGSSGGIRALIDGVLDIAVSGRPLKPEETNKGLAIGLQVRTPLVLATSHPSPNGLTREAVVAAFSAQNPLWDDGTAIRVILRPRSESDNALLGQLFPGLASAIEAARKRPDIPVAATDQDNAEMAEQLPGSLVGSTLAQLKTEKRNLRTVAIDGVAPRLEAFERADYPYGKTLYFVLPSTPKPLATRFLQFLRSPEGQHMLREADLSHANSDAIAVVRSIALLGISLGKTTTAEGVETEEQCERVRAEGCTEVQGYFIGKPCPAVDVPRLLATSCTRAIAAA